MWTKKSAKKLRKQVRGCSQNLFTFIILVGGIGGRGGIKMASAKNNQLIIRNDLILVHAVQLKPTIKVQISGRMASIGTSDVCDRFSILRENPYEQVDDENDNYYYYYE